MRVGGGSEVWGITYKYRENYYYVPGGALVSALG